ncbi:MAG: hypothetical protein WED07_10780 [Candidatus Freyarchaeum deiterrae]
MSICSIEQVRDKAKRVTRYTTLVDPMIGRELRQQGAYIPRTREIKVYCINCAVHRKLTRVRPKEDRRDRR